MNCLDVGDGKQQRESQMLPLSNEVEVAAAFVRELFEDEALERLRIAETLSRLLEVGGWRAEKVRMADFVVDAAP